MANRHTTDRNDPGLQETLPGGQQEAYLVLTKEQRAQGFVRPYRESYRHLRCGSTTTMSEAIAETYARSPRFYSGTFCVTCSEHFPVGPLSPEFPSAKGAWDEADGRTPLGEFVWIESDGSTGPPVGT